MEEQFVPFELAVKLKELGFDEDCLAIIPNNFKGSVKLAVPANGKIVKNDLDYFGGVKTPLWQQAFDWFREKHNLHHSILNDNEYWVGKNIGGFPTGKSNTYEESRLKCLEKLIELLETKKDSV